MNRILISTYARGTRDSIQTRFTKTHVDVLDDERALGGSRRVSGPIKRHVTKNCYCARRNIGAAMAPVVGQGRHARLRLSPVCRPRCAPAQHGADKDIIRVVYMVPALRRMKIRRRSRAFFVPFGAVVVLSQKSAGTLNSVDSCCRRGRRADDGPDVLIIGRRGRRCRKAVTRSLSPAYRRRLLILDHVFEKEKIMKMFLVNWIGNLFRARAQLRL